MPIDLLDITTAHHVKCDTDFPKIATRLSKTQCRQAGGTHLQNREGGGTVRAYQPEITRGDPIAPATPADSLTFTFTNADPQIKPTQTVYGHLGSSTLTNW
jgi:hypothetical protein